MLSEWIHFTHTQRQIAIGALSILLAIIFFDKIFKIFLKRSISKITNKRDNLTYTFLRDEKLIFWILCLPYLTIIHQGVKWIPDLTESLIILTDRFVFSCYILLGLFIFSNILRIIDQIYSRSDISKVRPIKGYLQSIEMLTFLFGFICILSIILNKSPLIFVSGLSAMTAVLLLVFKDTLLSFVAGVQLTANDLLRVGDWVEMPQFNADGDVVEIALNTVKIQNWDKTITVIPAHQFLAHSFKNWRGMSESGGRRIKRSLLIDLNTIRFLETSDLEKLSKIKVLRPYIEQKLSDVENYNKSLQISDPSESINFRRLTNVGTFRAYVGEYLKSHPHIHKNMTFLVRQLAPNSEGLPIEIYVFTNDTRWAIYESIQSDIFDHLYSVLKEFDLSPFQKPTGRDLRYLSQTK